MLLPSDLDCPRWITLDERVLFTFRIDFGKNSQESRSLTTHYIKSNSRRGTVFEETTSVHWGKERKQCRLPFLHTGNTIFRLIFALKWNNFLSTSVHSLWKLIRHVHWKTGTLITWKRSIILVTIIPEELQLGGWTVPFLFSKLNYLSHIKFAT